MKIKTLGIFFAALISAAAAVAQPRISWLETEHNFGAFSEDLGLVSVVFKYVNVGDEPLVITAARANCGCTTPRFSLDPLAPGDTASIEVKYDAKGRPGRFSKKVFVDTNTDPVRSTLLIKGVVVGAQQTVAQRYPVPMGKLSVARAYAMLGDVSKTHMKVEMLNAYNTTTDSIVPSVADTPAWLTVSCTPSPLAPGEQMSFNFMVHPEKTPLYGVVTDTISIIPDVAEPDVRFRMPVVVTLNEDFSKLTDSDIAKSPQASLLNERVDFGKVNLGTPLTATYVLRNDGKTPLIVRRVYAPEKDVDIAISSEKIKPGKKATITVTYTPRSDEQIVNLKINIITNDPLTPTQAVRFTAEPTAAN
jgi:hypothetical protein